MPKNVMEQVCTCNGKVAAVGLYSRNTGTSGMYTTALYATDLPEHLKVGRATGMVSNVGTAAAVLSQR